MESQKNEKPHRGFLRRAIVHAVTLIVGVGLAVVGLAAPSSAHHNTITGSVSCKQGGGWEVAWAVENSETRTETITASNRAVVPVGTQLTSRQVRTFKESFTSKPSGDVTLTLSSKWTNGVTATNSGTVKKSSFTDNCTPEEPKVTICHRTASYSNPYEVITVARSAVDGVGQGDHYLEHRGPIFYPSIPQHTEWGDIIPPVAGAHNGYNWTPEGQAVYKNGCKVPDAKDATASVTVSPATCDTSGTASVTGVKFATLVGTLDQSVGTHVATFKAEPGHLFANGSDTLQVSYTVAPKDTSKCEVVNPVNPEVQQSTCVDGKPTTPMLTLASTEGIAYTVSAQAPYGPGQTVVVTATWDATHNQPANLPAGWTKTSANAATYKVTFAKPDCTVTVQPPTIPVVDECGPNNAHYGAVPTGPWTSVTNSDGSVTVTANPGNTFPNGQSVTYPAQVDSNVPCPVPPTPPTPTCPDGTPWTDSNHNGMPDECVEIIPPVQLTVVKGGADMQDKCGTAGDMYIVKRDKGIVYTANGKRVREGKWLPTKGAKTVVVKAKAASKKYVLKQGSKTIWVFGFSTKPCKQKPDEPVHTGAKTASAKVLGRFNRMVA